MLKPSDRTGICIPPPWVSAGQPGCPQPCACPQPLGRAGIPRCSQSWPANTTGKSSTMGCAALAPQLCSRPAVSPNTPSLPPASAGFKELFSPFYTDTRTPAWVLEAVSSPGTHQRFGNSLSPAHGNKHGLGQGAVCTCKFRELLDVCTEEVCCSLKVSKSSPSRDGGGLMRVSAGNSCPSWLGQGPGSLATSPPRRAGAAGAGTPPGCCCAAGVSSQGHWCFPLPPPWPCCVLGTDSLRGQELALVQVLDNF